MAKLRVALCQINSVVGDITANTDRILAGLAAAERSGCHAAVFPELAITGYPPEDLVLKRRFVEDSRRAMEHIAAHTGSCTAVVGFVDGADGCWNAAGIAADGHLLGVYHKRELPNYGVFDERRYFQSGAGELSPHDIAGVSVGVLHLRGRLGRGWADEPVGRRRCRGGLQLERLAVPRRQNWNSVWGSFVSGWWRPAARWSTPTWWAARTSWCSTVPRW